VIYAARARPPHVAPELAAAWRAHIPDFVLDPADPPVKATGIAHRPARLPLVW
jgi:hypothetical protein